MKKVKPISYSVKAKRHTPQYQMHKYFARRPYNVISNLINHYTNENDIILDCFCGGGATIYEAISQNRIIVGVDLNPLSTFVTKMQIFNGDLSVIENLFNTFIEDIESKYKNVYKIKFNDDEGIIEWIELAYTAKCPYCNNIMLLSEDNKVGNGIYRCNNTLCQGKTGIKRLDTIPYKSVPLRVKYRSSKNDKVQIREIDKTTEIEDIEQFINEDNTRINPDIILPLNMDRQYEDRLKEKGILYYSDFFTKRNYYMNLFVFNEIINLKNKISKDLIEQLYFLFSSSLRYTNNMTKLNKNWERGNPSSMDKHAFWLPNQFIENNVISVLKKRKEVILKGLKFSKMNLKNEVCHKSNFSELNKGGDYLILNQSSTHLDIPDESIDCIITDPPYGSNVQYGELSIIWNVWYQKFKNIDNFLYTKEEAITNRRLPKNQGKKELAFYENMLFEIFSECYRVLKPEGYLVFTFNNKDLNIWLTMLRAVTRANFLLPEQGIIFQDYIESYKNTSHLKYKGTLQGDFIYSFQKCKDNQIVKHREYNIKTLLDSIDTTIEKISKDIVMNNKEISTTDLYQKILEKSTRNIIDFIQTGNKTDEYNIEFPKNYIDKVLKKYFMFQNGYWRRKE